MSSAVRFHKSENPGYDVDDLFVYLNKNIAAIGKISCAETFDDDRVEQLCVLLEEHHVEVNLQVLHLGHNELTASSATSLASLLYSNTTVRELDLSFNLLGNDGAKALCQPLSGPNTTLLSLLLEGNQLGPRGTKPIAQVLRHNSSLRELNLGNNDIGARGVKSLVKGLEACKSSLERLHLSGNNLSGHGIRVLLGVLGEGSQHSLTFLDLSSNQAAETGARALKDWLLFDKTTETLWLSSNGFGPEGGFAFESVLRFNYTLRELRLGGNGLGDGGVQALAHGLTDNSSLQRLALDYNRIEDEGAGALARVLKTNSTLEWLALNGNFIQSGCVALAEALPYVMGLRVMNLANNQMQDDAALAFANSLVKNNSTFEVLDWRNNNLTQSGMDALENAFRYRTNLKRWLHKWLTELRQNKLKSFNWCSKSSIGDYEVQAAAAALNEGSAVDLNTVYIGGPLITSYGVQALCEQVLSSPSLPCPKLVRLYIRGSNMGNEGAAVMGEALRTNTTLKSLSLTSSHITGSGASQLGRGLGENQTLVRLNLGYNQLGTEGLLSLAKCIQKHPKLSSLNAMANGITGDNPDLWDELAKTKIKELDLQDNALTDRVALDLAKAMLDHCPFTYINLYGNQVSASGARALSRLLPSETELACDTLS